MNAPTTLLRRRNCQGLTLVELMIATALGAFLILGAVQVYTDSRKAYDVYQTSARLQETARYAMSIIEPDVRLANYWGLLKGAGLINGAADQGALTAAAGALAGAAAISCGKNFSVDLGTFVQGDNDNYGLACAAYNGRPVVSADTLTVRRAATTVSAVPAATVGPLRVCTSRISGQLVNVATGCVAAPAGQVADLIVHGYYVARDSTQAANVPALHQWSLTPTPTFVDNEIISGVEDLQVQFGIDPTGTTGIATQYVDAFGPALLPAGAQIMAVRIWLLVRSDVIEVGFTDNNVYQYGNRATAIGTVANLNVAGAAGRAYAPADRYRRLLVSRTIMLRNALGT